MTGKWRLHGIVGVIVGQVSIYHKNHYVWYINYAKTKIVELDKNESEWDLRKNLKKHKMYYSILPSL